jgi:hypothetical protein
LEYRATVSIRDECEYRTRNTPDGYRGTPKYILLYELSELPHFTRTTVETAKTHLAFVRAF